MVAVTSYSEDGTSRSTSTIPLQVVHVELLEPHRSYEYCTPISRNIFRGDDDDMMPFIPYADDPTFDHVDHTLCYGSFAWQDDYDPDCEYLSFTGCDKALSLSIVEVISLEAAYRLHTVHSLLYEDIDSTGILPFKLFSTPGKTGLFTLSRRRYGVFDHFSGSYPTLNKCTETHSNGTGPPSLVLTAFLLRCCLTVFFNFALSAPMHCFVLTSTVLSPCALFMVWLPAFPFILSKQYNLQLK
jgi:hypothetical protein